MQQQASEASWGRVLRVLLDPIASKPDRVMVRWCLREGASVSENELVHYSAPSEKMAAAARGAREQLHRFAREGRLGLARTSEPLVRGLLIDLAKAGEAMFDALFSGADEEEAKYADKMLDWYRQNISARPDHGIRVEFCTQANSPVWTNCPWGVIYPSGSAQEPAPDNWEQIHDRFWAIRHKTCAYADNGPDSGRVMEKDLSAQDVASIDWRDMEFHGYVRGDQNMRVSVSQDLNDLADYLNDSVNGLIRSGHHDFPSATSHFYYLSRRDKDRDRTTVSDRLTPKELYRLIESSGPKSKSTRFLGFIDSTAVFGEGDNALEWYNAFQTNAWSVFIAVEGDTLDCPLDLIGIKIIADMIEAGPDLIGALDAVRHNIRPWGLLYGLYANPRRVRLVHPPPDKFHDSIRNAGRILAERGA